jgi:hypothetical protein
MMTAQCRICIHFLNTKDIACCIAFPNGIPIDILTGSFDHRNAYKNDNGIRFKSN